MYIFYKAIIIIFYNFILLLFGMSVKIGTQSNFDAQQVVSFIRRLWRANLTVNVFLEKIGNRDFPYFTTGYNIPIPNPNI